MLRLSSYIKLDRRICEEPNLTDRLSAEDLARIGIHCWEGYDADERSRAAWLRRTHAAMKLALQISENKTFPWQGCADVSFPLITIAVLQFHARAYPTMFAGPDIVKFRVAGVDPTGELTEAASLVARYMSHQCLDLDEAFEEQHDRLLINVPIVGCAFMKTTRNVRDEVNTSTLVLARDLVVDYFAKSIDSAARKTHLIPLYRNEVYERCVGGLFRDVLDEPWYKTPFAVPTMPLQGTRDQSSGFSAPQPDESTPILFGEQHCYLDLDGDGYAEPYIVTFDIANKQVVRIVARWERPEDVEMRGSRILRINATESFTKYGLIPSPDGSIYDIGFGVLLGPLNESTNTLVNQLIDAGTISNTAGGFISRGVKIRGGAVTFRPFGWQTVDSTGTDLKNGLFPFPVREPSQVLFNLLSLLINYVQRISGSSDALVGENPGQNTPAANMNTMVEQGMKIYAASFRRLWRSLRDEFRKLYILNGRHMPEQVPFGAVYVPRTLFLSNPSAVVPAADPNLVSETQRSQLAVALKQAAAGTPGYDVAAVERNFLRSMHVDGIEQLYPGPDKVPQGEDIKITLEKMRGEREMQKLQFEMQEFTAELEAKKQVNDAQILNLQAQAANFLKQADGIDYGHQIAALEAAIGAMRTHNDVIHQRLNLAIQAKQAQNAANKA